MVSVDSTVRLGPGYESLRVPAASSLGSSPRLALRAVAQWLVHLAAAQQREEQHRQLACRRHDCAFLRALAALRLESFAETFQVAVWAAGTKDVLRALHEQPASHRIAALADAQLRIVAAGLVASRHQPEVGTHVAGVAEALGIRDHQREVQRR